MRQETKEALAIEITKEKISNMDRFLVDKESAYLWYATYEQSIIEIHEAENKYCLEVNSEKPTVFD